MQHKQDMTIYEARSLLGNELMKFAGIKGIGTDSKTNTLKVIVINGDASESDAMAAHIASVTHGKFNLLLEYGSNELINSAKPKNQSNGAA